MPTGGAGALAVGRELAEYQSDDCLAGLAALRPWPHCQCRFSPGTACNPDNWSLRRIEIRARGDHRHSATRTHPPGNRREPGGRGYRQGADRTAASHSLSGGSRCGRISRAGSAPSGSNDRSASPPPTDAEVQIVLCPRRFNRHWPRGIGVGTRA